jgi:hypothetical protein
MDIHRWWLIVIHFGISQLANERPDKPNASTGTQSEKIKPPKLQVELQMRQSDFVEWSDEVEVALRARAS